MEFLEGMGGEVTMNQAAFSAATGVPAPTLQRYLSKMERYGVTSVVRETPGFGQGRNPNRYTLVISSADWFERGDAIVKAHRAAERERKAAALAAPVERAIPAVESLPDVPTADELALAKAEADAELEAAPGDDLAGWGDPDDGDD